MAASSAVAKGVQGGGLRWRGMVETYCAACRVWYVAERGGVHDHPYDDPRFPSGWCSGGGHGRCPGWRETGALLVTEDSIEKERVPCGCPCHRARGGAVA
jgi:hypothetical protein